MGCLGEVIWKTAQGKLGENEAGWRFICDVAGLNELTFKSSINCKQNMGPMQKYTARLSGKMDNFMPFNLANSLYASIRPNYKAILRTVLDSLEREEKQEELWLIAERLMLPSVLISGSCIFNGQSQEKTKEEMAFGLFYDQFERITELLTDAKSLVQNVKIVVMMEKKKRMFSGFFEILKSKQAKIADRVRAHPEVENRYRGRNMSTEDVIHALDQMGVSREEAEIALDNIEYPDHNLAMDWIDNHQDQIEEMIMTRTMERTRQEVFRREVRNVPMANDNQILSLSY